MGFITHIPGTQPVQPPEKHPQAKGVGVIGLHEGRTLLMSLQTRCMFARSVAGCDLNPEKLGASKAEYPDLFYTSDYDAMLARADVDVVAIYTPDAHHAEHIVRAFEAGKDVICTKPLVNSLEHAARILDAGRRTGRKLLVGQSSRFFEPFRRQRAELERGAYGGLPGIELVDAHYIHRMDWYYRKSPWAATETDWVFLGMSHPIDLVRWYLGRIVQVSAFGFRSAMGRQFGLRGNDVCIANFVAADGRIGRAMGHYGCHELPRARNCIELMLYGSGGTSLAQYHDMRYVHTGEGTGGEGWKHHETDRKSGNQPEAQARDKQAHSEPLAQAKAGGVQSPVKLPGIFEPGELAEVVEDYLYAGRHYYFNSEVHGMHYGEFANYADHFAKSLIEGCTASPSLEEGVETYCVMEAVKRSSDTRRAVDVEPLLREVGVL
ncbi:MAG: gfo/Idh/MocA family oxidoreductase [Leptolyngbya sp. PLA3]|nr:MAG: gfo/Idh/MocA family oxidoreductase [Cyanobacteria bacterium CYA]MCE7968836.1 gfo/Idh/MocA family oxidoreductase [Leptolyngbya sp. PL-A3]